MAWVKDRSGWASSSLPSLQLHRAALERRFKGFAEIFTINSRSIMKWWRKNITHSNGACWIRGGMSEGHVFSSNASCWKIHNVCKVISVSIQEALRFDKEDKTVDKSLRMWCITPFFRHSAERNANVCTQGDALGDRIKSRDYHCRSPGGCVFSEVWLFSHFKLPAWQMSWMWCGYMYTLLLPSL